MKTFRKVFPLLCLLLSGLLSLAQPAGGDEALADQFFREGDFRKAASLYQQLYEENDPQRYYSRLINSLMALKDFGEAERIIRERGDADPGDYRYLLDLGHLYKESGQPEKAAAQFRLVLKNLPAENHLVSGIAYSLYNYGENTLAIGALLEARKRTKDPSAFSFELARLYYLDKQVPGTIEELLNLLGERPEYLENVKGQLQFYLREEKDFSLLREMLEKRIRQNPGNDAYPELLIWRCMQQKDFGEALKLAIALEKKGKQAPDGGNRILRIAQICSANGAYAEAVEAYRHLISKGPGSPWYSQAKISQVEARRKQVLSGGYRAAELEALEKEYMSLLDEFGKNPATATIMRQLAVLRGRYLDRPEAAIALLEETIALNVPAPFRAECKLELGDLYVLADDVWEATLLYGQVETAFRDHPLGQEARFRNARLSYYIGEFEWARGQLDVLKAATSQLIANDALNLSLLIGENPGPDSSYGALRMYARAELLAFRNRFDDALAVLDSIPAAFPGHALTDDILMAKARIFIRQDRVTEATGALEKVAGDYAYDIWADDALFELAGLYERRLKDPAKAQELYEKLLLDHPGSLYVTEARKRFRTLRGDLPEREEDDLISAPVTF